MSDYPELENQSQPTFVDALAELKSGQGSTPSPDVMAGLSNLTSAEIEQLQPIWNQLDKTYRRVLIQMLVDLNLSNFEYSYTAIGWANLNAKDAPIRQAAIELLWENESEALMHKLIALADNDPALGVRIEAVKALGRFVL